MFDGVFHLLQCKHTPQWRRSSLLFASYLRYLHIYQIEWKSHLVPIGFSYQNRPSERWTCAAVKSDTLPIHLNYSYFMSITFRWACFIFMCSTVPNSSVIILNNLSRSILWKRKKATINHPALKKWMRQYWNTFNCFVWLPSSTVWNVTSFWCNNHKTVIFWNKRLVVRPRVSEIIQHM